ncbi:hypothetical protein GCM10008111_15920 [Alishewanella tabrizica]|uniref:Uncharacterized protein n=1 Tax=Alishewanella tabrizica TaxID=671278 RepID=A0ABQ2WP89_9ALTE|nr:hypothetical protein GCM10008111_15920 [Alishewanella tabrizica]
MPEVPKSIPMYMVTLEDNLLNIKQSLMRRVGSAITKIRNAPLNSVFSFDLVNYWSNIDKAETFFDNGKN